MRGDQDIVRPQQTPPARSDFSPVAVQNSNCSSSLPFLLQSPSERPYSIVRCQGSPIVRLTQNLLHPDASYLKPALVEGGWRDGAKHGKGKATYPDGGYEGDFRDGLPHGRGTLTGPDGSQYRGEFADGRMTGRGTRILPDGRREEGVFDTGRLVSGRVEVVPPAGLPDGHREERTA